ncbi:MAG: hypothetical protein CFE26_03990 [Verrucomicrobiales bacterium VVV1]|nr:MAG: hypothetical protein CFE26_03990 [Verrucomicrobiales bacterium VVV1]
MFHITPPFPALQPSPRLRPAGRSDQRLFHEPPARSKFLAAHNLAADPALAEIKAKLQEELAGWIIQQGDKGQETEYLANTRQGKNDEGEPNAPKKGKGKGRKMAQ